MSQGITVAPTATKRLNTAAAGMLPIVAGMGAAALLFFALAALQPTTAPEDAARLQAVWGQATTVELPPLDRRRSRPKPETPPPTPPRRPPLPQPRAVAPVAPRAAIAHRPPATPRIDPLLQNMALSPAGLDGSGPTLAIDHSASALGDEAAGSWLGSVDSRALQALTGLRAHGGTPRTRREANRKPQWLQRIEPEYPPEALRRNQEGTVSLRLRVDVAGRVLDAEVLDAVAGYGFAQAAVAAARKSSFIPGTGADGEPVEQWIKVSYLFQLQ